MNPNKLHKLAVGGPFNGERVHWTGNVVEYPGDVSYRLAYLRIDDAVVSIYIFGKLTNEEAIKLLQDDYLGT